jgi:hypothetical protein
MHSGPSRTGAPSAFSRYQTPVAVSAGGSLIYSVGWVTESSYGGSFAASDAGASLSHTPVPQGGGAASVLTDTTDNRQYTQSLWMLPLWEMRLAPDNPQPFADLDAGEDPVRLNGWVWEGGDPSFSSIRWLPYDQLAGTSTIQFEIQNVDAVNLTPTNISDACAHGITFSYYDASLVADTTTYRGYVADAYTTSSHWVPSSSLSAGFSVTPTPADFSYTPTDDLGCNLQFDLAAGDGVEIPVADYLTLDTAYILVTSDWQNVQSGPAGHIYWAAYPVYTYPTQNSRSVSALYAEYETGIFHFTYFDGPSAVDPVVLRPPDAGFMSTITWTESVSDQDTIRMYEFKLYDETNPDTVVTSFVHSSSDLTGFNTVDMSTGLYMFPGRRYYVTVQAFDSYGPGPLARSNSIFFDQPNLYGQFVDGEGHFWRPQTGGV